MISTLETGKIFWGNVTPHMVWYLFLLYAPQTVGDWMLGKTDLRLVQSRHFYILMAFNEPPSAKQAQKTVQMSYGTREQLWLPEGEVLLCFGGNNNNNTYFLIS